MGGNPGSWDPWIAASWEYDRGLYAWSPCGRFIAVENGEGVEIYDSLSFELLSTLMPIESAQESMDQLAYSMDGRSAASVFGGSLVIWDTQTGGVAKEIEYGGTYSASLAWSLNGSTICIVSADMMPSPYTVFIYDIASGVMCSPGTLPSADEPYVWARDTSFRIMTTAQDGLICLINIFEVGSVLTRIESFHIKIRRRYFRVGSFSQTTYRISILVNGGFLVFDARTSRRLLEGGDPTPHCFSPDGSLFAGISKSESAVCIWKYTSDDYMPWREFPLPLQNSTLAYHSLQFSPTSSSLSARFDKFLRLWRLDGPPIFAHHNRRMLLVALSYCGSYVATSRETDTIVTITNLLSQSPPHFIDTGMMINTLALTGNILLALGSGTIVAWRLTGEGAVGGVFPGGRAGHGDSIWTVSLSGDPKFLVTDETVAIKQGGRVIWVYRTETGEVLEPTKPLIYHYPHYTSREMLRDLHRCRHDHLNLVLLATIQTGWAKDPEGRHQLWIPVEWRNSLDYATSLHDNKVLRLALKGGGTVLIRF